MRKPALSRSTSVSPLTSRTHAAIVSYIPIHDCAFHHAGRELQCRIALELRLVDIRLQPAIARVMLQGDKASLFAYGSDSSEDSAAAAEAILAGEGIEQQHNGWVAVILQAEGMHHDYLSSFVVSSIKNFVRNAMGIYVAFSFERLRITGETAHYSGRSI